MKRFLAIGAMATILGIHGCGTGVGGGVLDQLTSLLDADGDGFPELTPPEGVADTVNEMVAISLTNEITRAQAEQLVGQEIPSIVNVAVDITLTLQYADDKESVYTGTQGLEAFTLAFEAFCPETVIASFRLIATAPIVGTVLDQTMTFTASQVAGEGDAQFECGTVIEIRSFLNDFGQPDVDINITDQ